MLKVGVKNLQVSEEMQGNEEKTEETRQHSDEKQQEEIYDSNEYISGARRVQNGTVPMDILKFQYPFNFYTRIGVRTRLYHSLCNI